MLKHDMMQMDKTFPKKNPIKWWAQEQATNENKR